MILIVGSSNTFYVQSYVELLTDNGIEVDLFDYGYNGYQNSSINTHYHNRKNESQKLVQFFSKIAAHLKISDLKPLRKLKDILFTKKKINLERSYSTSIFFWGDAAAPHFNNLKHNKLGKKILIVNTFPIDFYKHYEMNKSDIDYYKSFDKVICSTSMMVDYFKKYLPNETIELCPDFIVKNKNLSNKKNFNKISNIAFLGNVNFNQRNSDDVSGLISNIEKEFNVTVHTLGDGSGNTFKPFNYKQVKNGEMNTYLNQNFDAVLYAYNSKGSLRENISITTRFSLFEGCGLPLIVDFSKYKGIVEDFNKNYTLIELDSINKSNIKNLIHNYDQESRINKFLSFL